MERESSTTGQSALLPSVQLDRLVSYSYFGADVSLRVVCSTVDDRSLPPRVSRLSSRELEPTLSVSSRDRFDEFALISFHATAPWCCRCWSLVHVRQTSGYVLFCSLHYVRELTNRLLQNFSSERSTLEDLVKRVRSPPSFFSQFSSRYDCYESKRRLPFVLHISRPLISRVAELCSECYASEERCGGLRWRWNARQDSTEYLDSPDSRKSRAKATKPPAIHLERNANHAADAVHDSDCTTNHEISKRSFLAPNRHASRTRFCTT